jgi:thiol:disulfide interchange protein
MLRIALVVIAIGMAFATLVLAGFAVLKRSLEWWEIALIAMGFLLIGLAVWRIRSRQSRRRLLDMRDSALW